MSYMLEREATRWNCCWWCCWYCW